MSSIVLASHGRARWCETALVKARVAQTFAEICPESRFLAFHRQCKDVIRATAVTFPWGIADTPLEEYGAAAGGLVNAAAAYWLHWTSQLVELEQSLGDQVIRIRYEDVAEDPVGTASRIRALAGIEGAEPNGAQPGGPLAGLGVRAGQPGESLPAFRDVPLGQIPDGLAAEIDTLSRQLGYATLRESL
jgi:Sulfotransferase family